MRIAVFTKNWLNRAYEGARLGADKAAAEAGATTLHYVPEKADDPGQQAALIVEALAERPDAFVLVPAHPTEVNAAIRSINASDIPLFAFVNRLTDGECVSFIGADDYELALKVAHHAYGQLEGKGKVILLEGPADSVTSQPRVAAFRDAAVDYPGIEIVGSCHGRFLREPAKEETALVLPQLPQLDAILAANDSMALGAIDALEAADRSALVAGINGIPEAIDAIKQGSLTVTADFNAMNMAFIATRCAVRHLRGEPVPKEVMLPAQLIDRENYELWDKPFSERTPPDWDAVT